MGLAWQAYGVGHLAKSIHAMGWMLSFHKGPDDGSIESVTLRQKPIPHWLVAVADTTDGRIEHLLFAVILPNGYVIVPMVSEQL
jgi:hypothetical protein